MASGIYFIHYLRRWQENNNDVFLINASEKGLGKSTLSIHLARDYIQRFGFICPHCGNEFYKNLYKVEKVGNSYRFYIPDSIKSNQVRIRCPEHYELDVKTGVKKKISGCGETFLWSERKRIKWSASKFIAYDNGEARRMILNMPMYSPLICLAKRTPILIKDKKGIRKKKIKDLVGRTDFEVMTYNINENKFETKKPEKCILTSKKAETYTIELEDGKKLIATPEHLVYTKRGYVAVKDLKETDEIKIYTKRCIVCNKELKTKKLNQKYCGGKCQYSNHREESISYQIRYRKNNREKIREARKLYIKNNRETYLESKRKEYNKHRKYYLKRNKEYWQKNKIRLIKQNKEWIKNNHKRYRKSMNKWHKKTMVNNPNSRLSRNLRRRVGLALKDQGMFQL